MDLEIALREIGSIGWTGREWVEDMHRKNWRMQGKELRFRQRLIARFIINTFLKVRTIKMGFLIGGMGDYFLIINLK